jgi:hypothetical protein
MVVSTTLWSLYPRETLGTDLQEAGWASGVCLDGNEHIALTGIRSAYCHVHSESLYRLSYPGCRSIIVTKLKILLNYVLARGQQTCTQQFHSVCRLQSHAGSDDTEPFLGWILVLAPNPTKAAQFRADVRGTKRWKNKKTGTSLLLNWVLDQKRKKGKNMRQILSLM